MKIVNEKFIESLKGARNISAILTYNSNKSYRILTNEASENITTELNELLATEKGAYEVKDNQLLRINPSFNVNLFKTVCKSLEIETTENIAANEKINIKIGVKVDENYQFLNFGNYIVKNSTYQADTDTYLLVAYDKMMESMIKYDDNPLSITYPIEHKNLIIAICEKLNWSYEIDDYLNSNAIIDKDLYSGQNLTYRDILDDLLTAVGENLLFDLNDKLVNKKIENSFLSDNIMGGNSLYLKEALESDALEYSIDGKCEQATRSGKNLYNYKDTTNVGDGVTADKDGWITITADNTSGTSVIYRNYFTKNLNLKTNTNYAIVMEVKNVSRTGDNAIWPVSVYSTTEGQFDGGYRYDLATLSNNTIKVATRVTKSNFTNISNGLRTFLSVGAGAKSTITFRLSVLEDTTVTAETFKYEAFGASPSPDYPSEIKTIKGIRNLLNLNAPTSTTSGITCTNNNDGSITINGHTTAGFAYYLTNDNITFEKGKKYTISAKVLSGSCTNYTSSTSWAFKFIADINNVNATVTDIGSTTKEVEKTFDGSNASAKPYLWFGWTSSTTDNDAVFNDLRVQFMVEEGDTKHSFVPYGTYEKIKVTGKNLFDKDNTYTAIGEVSGYVSSDYIPVKKGDTINKTNSVMFWFYDKSKNQIGFASGSTTTTVSLDNVAYVRCNVLKTDLDTFMLTINQELTNYEPYKEKEVLIDLAKENLLETPYTESNKLTATATKNDYYAVIDYYAELEAGKTYTFSCKTDGTFGASNQQTQCYLLFDKKYDYIIHMDDKNCFTFTPTQTGKYYVRYDVNVKGETHSFWDFAIYKGTNADSSYELNSIGDTKDKLELINGVANIQKKIGKVVLNGSESNWIYDATKKRAVIQITNSINTNYDNANFYCSHFKPLAKNYTTNNVVQYKKRYYFYIEKVATTLDEWKTWLSENNTTIYYELAETQQIILPNVQIPLFEGINHVTLVEDLETTTSIIYKKPFIIDDELLKDVNVDFKEKYGPVNSLTISSNNTVINSLEDKKSIEKNGKITFNINDNYLLNYNSDTFINQLFNKIYNLEYYIYDFDSTGILVLEALDKFIVNHNNNNYNCLMLNDDIKLTTGLIETTYAEKPKENVDEYTSVTPLDKKINNALISIDKANAEIVLKVDSNGKIAQARLDGDADKGSEFIVKADNIKLEGYSTINKGFVINVDGDAQVHGSLFTVTNGNRRINPAVITVRDYNKGKAKGEYYADQIILSNNDGTDIFTVGDGNIGDYHGGVLTLGNDEVDSSITMYDGIINCVEVNQSSLESIKKNFEKLENGLSIVEKAEIYKYNLKKENDDDKKHIGLVIGDKYNTPYEVISKNGNSIDTYSMISVAWQCIKELNDKINNLEKEISKLKGESK